jgi:hypothetical protein
MQIKEDYLDRVLGEVEDLASRVALLNGRLAKQNVSVKLEHYWNSHKCVAALPNSSGVSSNLKRTTICS